MLNEDELSSDLSRCYGYPDECSVCGLKFNLDALNYPKLLEGVRRRKVKLEKDYLVN